MDIQYRLKARKQKPDAEQRKRDFSFQMDAPLCVRPIPATLCRSIPISSRTVRFAPSTKSGSPISLTFGFDPASSTWPRFWTFILVESSAGPSPNASTQNSVSLPIFHDFTLRTKQGGTGLSTPHRLCLIRHFEKRRTLILGSWALVIYSGSNEISCSLFAPKDEKWRTSSVAAYCRATRRSRVALNFWRAVDPANEIDQSTLSEPRIVSAGVRFPDAGMNA